MNFTQIQATLTNLPIPDYVLGFLMIVLGVIGFFIGLDRIYKAYLGTMLGVLLFLLVHFTLYSQAPATGQLTWFQSFLTNHRVGLGLGFFFFIPVLSVLLPLNTSISFRLSENAKFRYSISILFGLLYIPFFLASLMMITGNHFLFPLEKALLESINTDKFVVMFFHSLNTSHIYAYIFKFTFWLHTGMTLYIFYKMTVGGMVDFVLRLILDVIIKVLRKIKENIKTEKKKSEPKKEEKKEEKKVDHAGGDAHGGGHADAHGGAGGHDDHGHH